MEYSLINRKVMGSVKVLKMGMRGCFLALVFLFSFGESVDAQDFKQALKDMQEEYATTDQLHIVMDVQVFEKETASRPFFQETVDIRKDGINFLYKFGANEMLMNAHYLIRVLIKRKKAIYVELN